jgi:hypothetical protein
LVDAARLARSLDCPIVGADSGGIADQRHPKAPPLTDASGDSKGLFTGC